MDSAEIVDRMAEAIYDAKGYAGCSKTDTGETRTVWADSLAYARAAYAALVDDYGRPEIEGRTVIDAWTIPAGERTERRLVFSWRKA